MQDEDYDDFVTDPPVAQISLVEPKEPRLLREDENAMLLCSADAAPAATNFTFYKDPEVNTENTLNTLL